MAAEKLLQFFDRRSPAIRFLIVLFLLALVGGGDYLIGYQLSLLIFYLIPICLTAWFVGRRLAIFIAMASVVIWIVGDRAAGAYSSPFVLTWNGLAALGFFLVVVFLVDHLRQVLDDLEYRVDQRTAALSNEITARRRLEQEVLDISEREQRRIGHDLHDTVCQHLTGTALAAKVLQERLSKKASDEAAAATQIVDLVEEAIDLTRNLAKGLTPVEVTSDGFMDALHQLAANVSHRYSIRCGLDYEDPLLFPDLAMATHVYRIAQEAVFNAVKHARAGAITIEIGRASGRSKITIKDDGIGLPQANESDGMGIQIMSYRASLIGATLSIERNAAEGTSVTCILPPQPRNFSSPR